MLPSVTLDRIRRIAVTPQSTSTASPPATRKASFVSAALVAGNAFLFMVQQRLNELAVHSMRGPAHTIAVPTEIVAPREMLALPYPTVAHDLHPSETIHIELLLVSLLQAAVLWGLWRALPHAIASVRVRIVLVLAVVAMFGDGVVVRALSSMDTYAYAGYAKLGLAHAYDPAGVPFAGSFERIGHLWGRPIVACVYGPLWVFVNQVLVGGARTLGQAVFLERLIAVGAYGVMLFALRKMRVHGTWIAIVAINPALIDQFVVNGHNDIIGVTFVLFALATVVEWPLLAAGLVACAGLVKITLLAFALVVFGGRGRLKRRTLYAGLSIVSALAASLVFGGPAYVDALIHHGASVNAVTQLNSSMLLTRILAAFAVCVLATCFLRGDIFRAGTWSFCALTGLIFPWYLIWALPYALRARPAAAHFLVLLPVVAAALQTDYPDQHAHQYVLAAIIAMLAGTAIVAIVPIVKKTSADVTRTRAA